jgi:cytochrome P450
MSKSLAAQRDTVYDLFDMDDAIAMGGGLVEDPWPLWKAIREKGPVHKGTVAECMGLPPERHMGMYLPGHVHYSVFSFAGVSDVFTRKDDFDSSNYLDADIPGQFGDTILNMDGLRHRRYRNVIQNFFQPEVAKSWWRERVIDPTVDEILDTFEGERSVDINMRFFAILPQHTMTSGFGLSFEEGLDLRRNMLASLNAPTEEARHAASRAAGLVLENAIRERQRGRRDDLISHLAHTDLEEDDGSTRKLTVEEITSFCRLIVFAGGETTWRMMGIAMFALLNHPDQLELVKADRSLLQWAVLESVRWHPDPIFPRKVKRDTVLQGVELKAGTQLMLCLGAANRDPERWENPDVYDVRRPFKRSVAFAAGAHSCLGQHVARQEIEAAIGTLLDRFPNIRWDPDQPAPYIRGAIGQRQPNALPVLLD